MVVVLGGTENMKAEVKKQRRGTVGMDGKNEDIGEKAQT